VDIRHAEGWLRQLAEGALRAEGGGDPLAGVRSAAAGLCAIGVLPEARGEAVLAEAACALAVRGLAPAGELAARRPPLLALAATRRRPPADTTVAPYETAPLAGLGGVGLHAYARTGTWGRVVGYAPAPIPTDGPADLLVTDVDGRSARAVGGPPVCGDGWAQWSLTLDTSLDSPQPSGGGPPAGDPPVIMRARLDGPPASEGRAEQQLRLATNVALASAAAGQPPADALTGTIDALVVAGGLPASSLAVANARLLAGWPQLQYLLPEAWASVLDRDRLRRVRYRAPTIGPGVTIQTGSGRITIGALIPGRVSFLVFAHVWPWNPSAPATRLVPGDNSRLAWWATDNHGRAYIGRYAFVTLANTERFGPPADIGADVAIVYRPPIARDATTITVAVG
jgi:hypothetical protein